MCLCCCAKAQDVGEIVDGFYLVRGTVDIDDTYVEWKAGQYAIVVSNDPDYVFDVTPQPEPPTDENNDDAKQWDDWENWFEQAQEQAENMKDSMSLNTCHQLVEACIKAGYSRDKDGDVGTWLISRIGHMITVHETIEKEANNNDRTNDGTQNTADEANHDKGR